MKTLAALAVVLLLAVSAFTVSRNEAALEVSGSWRGMMIQPEGPMGPDGFYELRLEVVQTGEDLSGSSHIAVPGTDHFGRMEFAGRVVREGLTFEETHLAEENPRPGKAWCLKQARLKFDPDLNTLTGRWEAPQCSPGVILLYRVD